MTDINFGALKRDFSAGIAKMEMRGDPVEAVPAELLKTAAVLALKVNGPFATMEGLSLLLKQLGETFPDEWAALCDRHFLASAIPAGEA